MTAEALAAVAVVVAVPLLVYGLMHAACELARVLRGEPEFTEVARREAMRLVIEEGRRNR